MIGQVNLGCTNTRDTIHDAILVLQTLSKLLGGFGMPSTVIVRQGCTIRSTAKPLYTSDITERI
jgi:hypothetical protein